MSLQKAKLIVPQLDAVIVVVIDVVRSDRCCEVAEAKLIVPQLVAVRKRP